MHILGKPAREDIILRNSAFWAIGISIAVALVSFGSNLLVAHNLPVSDFALYAASVTFLNFLGISFSGFQIRASTIAARRDEYITPGRDGFSRSLLKGSVILMLLFAASSLIWNSYVGMSPELLLILSVAFPVVALSSLVNGRLAGSGKLATQSLMSLAILLTNLVAQIAISLTFEISTELLVAQLVFINGLFIAWMQVSRKGSFPNEENAFNTKNLVTVAKAGLFWFLANFDILLCSLFLSEEERNQYAVAATFSRMLLFFFATLFSAMFTKLNRNIRDKIPSKRLLRRSAMTTLIASVAIAIVIFYLGEQLLVMFYGAKYSSAGAIFRMLGFASIPFLLAQFTMQIAHLQPNLKLAFLLLTEALIVVFVATLNVQTSQDLVGAYAITGLIVLFTIWSILNKESWRGI